MIFFVKCEILGDDMSPREEAQNKLVDWLETTSGKWNAPYGILPGLENLKRGGKVRTITFGMARWLDATAYIWSPTKITFMAAGPASTRLDGLEVGSVEAAIAALEQL